MGERENLPTAAAFVEQAGGSQAALLGNAVATGYLLTDAPSKNAPDVGASGNTACDTASFDTASKAIAANAASGKSKTSDTLKPMRAKGQPPAGEAPQTAGGGNGADAGTTNCSTADSSHTAESRR